MASAGPQPFLSRPAEVRLAIYTYIASSRIDDMRDYTGFLQSCKKVYAELGYECTRLLDPVLEQINSLWPEDKPVQIARPQRYGDLRNLCIEFPDLRPIVLQDNR